MRILEKFPLPSPEAVAEYEVAHKAKEEAEDRAISARKGLELYWLRQEWNLLKMEQLGGEWEWAVELYSSRSHLSRVNRQQLTQRAVSHPGTLDNRWRMGWDVKTVELAEVGGNLYPAWMVDSPIWGGVPREELAEKSTPVQVLTSGEWGELKKRMLSLPPLNLRDPS